MASILFGITDRPLNLIRLLSILCLAAPLLTAQEEENVGKKSPIALLPSGSVLQDVLLPRYDSERNLVGDLKAEVMTLIDEGRVQGENVRIKFYHPDRSERGRISLKRALFDQEKSTLTAKEPVEILSDRIVARGSGLVYAFEGGKGFLNGPATTWIIAPPTTPTSMNRKSTIFPSTAMALSLLTANAAPPAYVTADELAEIKADAAPMEPQISAENAAAKSRLAADAVAGEKSADAARAFINDNDIRTVAGEKSAEPEKAAEPLAVKPGPNDTVISCDGGMYFDADAGVLVYLENVKVVDPRFNLSGAKELKVFFDKKPGDKKAATKNEGGMNLSGTTANFGDVQKLVANGAVRILQKGVAGKEPVEASGAVLTYNVPKGEIIINGGYPWVKQGSFYARAKQPNLTLRLLNDGSFSTQGNWEMGGNLNLKGK